MFQNVPGHGIMCQQKEKASMRIRKLLGQRFARRKKHRFDYRNFPEKLNLGCGLDKRNDYLNVDLNTSHEPDLVCDVSNLHPLPSGYYDAILARDILEHIQRPKIQNTLKEWNRVLQMNGTFAFRVPNATSLLELLNRDENRNVDAHYRLIQCLFGTQTYDGDFHHFAFTDILLKDMLSEAGFRLEILTTEDHWLFSGNARKIRNAPVDDMFNLPDDTFIDELYRSLLKRNPDPEGKHFYLSLLQKGISREAVVETIRISPEYARKHSGSPDDSQN
jgi:predicted SAM-dependent methyltransferase